jgi:hypothetical protein
MKSHYKKSKNRPVCGFLPFTFAKGNQNSFAYETLSCIVVGHCCCGFMRQDTGGGAPGEELNDLFDVIPGAEISFPAMEVTKLYGSDEKVVSSECFKDGTAWHQPGGAGLAFCPKVKIQFPYSGVPASCDVTLTVDFSLDGYDRNMSPSTLHVHRECTFTAYGGM